ncbi:helix-turn-helix transcriptional regulator [Ligilactobacillus salivarius]|uniref:helix-turn-helix domain-containing protein n=1 Tax=Ligilactobacillus salivarius TaxID=1624 RepID=UPI00195BF520|nr:helix-turn-helix transcriptional regulator [Ligilactobacillus salivarius]MBM6708772.1 helix-turn-helix transcriptional regulator [Ligilactobacillus salivarius]
MQFSNQIKARRKQLGLTQAEVANQLYITRQTISNWEQGKSYPDLNTILNFKNKLATGLK